jgi:hypothetical protein
MPDGYYLHVAVKTYCRDRFNCYADNLTSSLDDSDALHAAALRGGFTKKLGDGVLRGAAHATATNIKDTLQNNIRTPKSGDYLLVTWVGYGVQPVVRGQVSPNYRGWLLGDGTYFQLVDLFALLAGANTGVRILVVSVSCFSGNVVNQPDPSKPRILEVTKDRASELYNQQISFADLDLSERNSDPSIYHLTACGLNETVSDGQVNAQGRIELCPFVENVRTVLNDGMTRNFNQFLDEVRKKCMGFQPQLERRTAIESAFFDVGPFRVV